MKYLEIVRQRNQLGRLDDRVLKDIGLTRADINSIARGNFEGLRAQHSNVELL